MTSEDEPISEEVLGTVWRPAAVRPVPGYRSALLPPRKPTFTLPSFNPFEGEEQQERFLAARFNVLVEKDPNAPLPDFFIDDEGRCNSYATGVGICPDMEEVRKRKADWTAYESAPEKRPRTEGRNACLLPKRRIGAALKHMVQSINPDLHINLQARLALIAAAEDFITRLFVQSYIVAHYRVYARYGKCELEDETDSQCDSDEDSEYCSEAADLECPSSSSSSSCEDESDSCSEEEEYIPFARIFDDLPDTLLLVPPEQETIESLASYTASASAADEMSGSDNSESCSSSDDFLVPRAFPDQSLIGESPAEANSAQRRYRAEILPRDMDIALEVTRGLLLSEEREAEAQRVQLFEPGSFPLIRTMVLDQVMQTLPDGFTITEQAVDSLWANSLGFLEELEKDLSVAHTRQNYLPQEQRSDSPFTPLDISLVNMLRK